MKPLLGYNAYLQLVFIAFVIFLSIQAAIILQD